MIKNILLATDGSDYAEVAASYALDLTKRLEARLKGIHVLDSRMLEGPLLADVSGWVGAQPYGAQLQQFRKMLTERGEAVMAAFGERCASEKVVAEQVTKMGHPIRILVEESARTELVVMGRKGEHAQWSEELMGSVADRVAHRCKTTCMITPDSFRPIHRVLAAYDGSGVSGEALSEAAQLTAALKGDLCVVTVEENHQVKDAVTVAEAGKKLAQAHKCRVSTKVIEDSSVTNALLDAAREEAADLLVAGARGHSRLLEWLSGSVASQLINNSHLPVMIVR